MNLERSFRGNVVLKSGPQPSAAPARSHYSLRDRSAQRVASASRKTPTPIGKSPPPPKKVDPFAALLKEKRNAERLGTGGQALRRAEEILSVGSPLSEMTDDEEETDWTNEDTALAAVKALAASSDGVNDRDDEITVNDKDHRRLLGDKAGKEVAAILGSDRARREAAKGKQKVIGVHLWQDDDRSTKIESAISLWALDLNGPPILALLHSSLESDVFRASALLNSGVLARMNLFAYPAVVSCIFEHASSPSPLAIAAFNALSHVWSSSSSSASIVSFDVVLSALYRAGAKEDGVSVAERNDVLYRLVRLIALSTQSPLPASEDASSIIMALVLIGMDPTILPELRREIMGAIDLLCRSLGSDDQVAAQEPSLGRKLLQFALTLHSHNQSHLLALLAGGSERGRRIARWVAHTVISAAPEAQYSDLPPLAAVLNILSPTNERKSIFELHEDTDYVELVSQVQILGIALSNVDGYVKQEAQQRQLAPVPPSSPSKLNNEKPETILSRIRFAIETLHGNIVDTRAARLDRSRAKAALKQLSMRIHYQQEVALKSVRGAKMSRPIQQYFAKSK
ncbi:hypothetical protein C8F01DRAFT_1243317 [Mycena amicta]|nr:hypothetical protein C8F01DRAFT_1243317 [Mycena amicta]